MCGGRFCFIACRCVCCWGLLGLRFVIVFVFLGVVFFQLIF